MSRSTQGLRMLVAAAVVVVAACQETPEPTSPATEGQEPQEVFSTDPDILSQEIPGFGGLFLDETGRPTVYLKDVGQTKVAQRVLATFARRHGFDGAQIQVIPAAFSHAELDDWFGKATHAAGPLAGTVFIDLDEANNRVLVGVANAAATTGVATALEHAGIPAAAFAVVVTSPIENVATLRDRFRPTQGGIQIHFTQYLCTLGFNVTHVSSAQRSFITNSHCTATQGGVQGTVYYQPTSSVDPTVIATEVADPTYFKGGVCPRGKKCRYSDSSRALYSEAAGSSLGVIAKTTGPNNNDLTVAGSFAVTGEGSAVVGTTVNKVGRTTGWTQGKVTNTCVNTSVLGSQIMQLCQNFVSAGVAGGDSGSPVFTLAGGDLVTLVGILWGGSSDNKTFVYSPFSQIEQELGNLQVVP